MKGLLGNLICRPEKSSGSSRHPSQMPDTRCQCMLGRAPCKSANSHAVTALSARPAEEEWQDVTPLPFRVEALTKKVGQQDNGEVNTDQCETGAF